MVPAADSAPNEPPATARRRTVLWTLAFSYAGIVLVVARNFVLVPVYLAYLPLAEYGAWLATAGVLAQVLFMDFGLAGAITQRVAAAYGRGNRADLAATFGSSLAIAGALGVLVSVVTAAVGPLAARAMHLEGDIAARLEGSFLVLAAGSGPSVAGYTFGCALRSVQRPIFTGGAVVLAELAAIVATVTLLWAGAGLYALAAGLALRGALACILNLFDCGRAARTLGLKLRWSRGVANGLLGDTWRQLGTAVAMKVQGNADPFFVATLISPEVAAVYALTVRAHEAVVMLLAQIGASLSPALAHVVGAGDRQLFARVVRGMWIALGFVGALGFGGVIAFNRDFVGLWVHSNLYGGDLITWLAAGASFALLLGTTPYEALMAHGRFGALARVFVVTSLLHVALALTLLQFGPWGAACAALLSLGTRTVTLGMLSARLSGPTLVHPVELARVVVPVLAVAVLVGATAPPLVSWRSLLVAIAVYCAAASTLAWSLNRVAAAALRDQVLRRSHPAVKPA